MLNSRFTTSALVVLIGLGACSSPTHSSNPPPTQPEVPTASSGWSVIGRSVDDRPLLAKTRGMGPVRVYLIGGIHGDERPAIENAERLGVLIDTSLPPGMAVRLLRDANPDGTAEGTRRNVHGVDLNRNWPASNFRPHRERGPRPLSEPEAAAMYADPVHFNPELVIVLHAARGGPFVNYDGPARQLAERFAGAAATLDPRWRVVRDMGYPTPGSLGSWVGDDLQIPILTVELPRGADAEEVWPALRLGVLEVLERVRVLAN